MIGPLASLECHNRGRYQPVETLCFSIMMADEVNLSYSPLWIISRACYIGQYISTKLLIRRPTKACLFPLFKHPSRVNRSYSFSISGFQTVSVGFRMGKKGKVFLNPIRSRFFSSNKRFFLINSFFRKKIFYHHSLRERT